MSAEDSSIQDAFLVWIRRTSSILSIVASSAIIFMIVIDRKIKFKQPSHRLLLAMSVFDVIQSIAQAFASAPIPRETQAYGAIGNAATCSTQGFFLQLGFAVPLYNTSLSLFYLLSIRYNISSKQFAKRIEPYCHFVAISYPLLSAIVGVCLGLYDRRGFVCWIKSLKTSGSAILLWVDLIVVTLCFIFILSAMTLTYMAVLKREKDMSKYDFLPTGRGRLSIIKKGVCEARETMIQAFFYVAGFFITFIWVIMTVAVTEHHGSKYELKLLASIFFPLQGLWNFFVYTRRGRSTLRRQYPERSCFWVLYTLIVVPSSTRRESTVRRSSARSTINYKKYLPSGDGNNSDFNTKEEGFTSTGKDELVDNEDSHNNDRDTSLGIDINENISSSKNEGNKKQERRSSFLMLPTSLPYVDDDSDGSFQSAESEEEKEEISNQFK